MTHDDVTPHSTGDESRGVPRARSGRSPGAGHELPLDPGPGSGPERRSGPSTAVNQPRPARSGRPLPATRPGRATRTAASLVAVALAVGTLAACGPDDDGTVTLNFFQFKPEAVAQFDEIIEGFEAENPGIEVVQNHVPNADTALRTLLVKDKIPDVMTLNAGATFGELARAGVFADVTDLPVMSTVADAPVKIVTDLGQHDDEISGVPFALAASSIIYNKTIFAEHDVEVPQTWDELLAAADTFQAAGVTPFYGTLKDQWTVLPSFNNLAGALQPDGFFDDLRALGTDAGPGSEPSFSTDYREATEKLVTLFSYNQPNRDSRDYNAGNKAFADGESAMYLQGTYAIAPILENNPDLDLGTFPYPVTDDPEDTVLVTGVDVVLAIGRDTPHRAEVEKFVDYMMRPENVDAYGAAQSTFSPLVDAAPSTNPYLAGLDDYVEQGRIIGYVDHQIPAAVPLQPMLQQLIIDGDVDAFLSNLDSEWRKVAARSNQR